MDIMCMVSEFQKGIGQDSLKFYKAMVRARAFQDDSLCIPTDV